MPKKKASGTPSTTVRRSTRIKRDETKNDQVIEEAIQEVFSSENEEIRPKPLPKKRTNSSSPASKNTRTKTAHIEDEHQTTEEMKVPNEDNQESGAYKTEASKDTSSSNKDKGKNKVINIIDDASTTESASFVSFKSQDTLTAEKSSVNTSLSNISKHDNSVMIDDDETDPHVQAKWEIVKAQLFEVPREPRPPYREYTNKLFVRRPWMKKKDIDYLQKLYTDSKSLLAKKQLKTLFNFATYNSFTDEQKSRLLRLLPNCDLVPIANEDGDPIDTPRIEREYVSAGLDSYDPGISEPVRELDPAKVCPRFDFWLSDSFKDARWWFQTSIKYGYNTKNGVDTQWNNFEKFKTEIPKNWKNDEYEQEWGIGLWGKLEKKQIAGDSAQISLPEMAKAQIIRLDDTLRYKRQFKNVGITVSMDLKVVAVNKSNGHLQFKLIKDEQDKIINDIHNPTRLENEVLDFDGRVAKSSRPNGNAFKNFSIVRSEDYTPSLFEARKEYWAKNQ
ncbi:4366_t:CDS:2 [Funneliformis mosseae]|uniref:4366_t:CDS:1 n=1 Tax=Funneliformis mosseae TaxID=27381 RepID=A0A9N8ZF93_FUNMO|nr:4366_t:CDS:2 [Funneliformis mosseae]